MPIKFRALYPDVRAAILEDGSLVSYSIRQSSASAGFDITLTDANVTDERVKTKPAPFAHPDKP